MCEKIEILIPPFAARLNDHMPTHVPTSTHLTQHKRQMSAGDDFTTTRTPGYATYLAGIRHMNPFALPVTSEEFRSAFNNILAGLAKTRTPRDFLLGRLTTTLAIDIKHYKDALRCLAESGLDYNAEITVACTFQVTIL